MVRANDQFSVHGPARTGFTSSEEKYYDFSITYQEDDKVETFEVIRIGTVPDEEGTFKVTDFSKLSDPSGEPVSYTTEGTTIKISTGEDGEEIQERWEEADKKKNEDEGIMGMLTDVYFYVPNYYFIVGIVVLLVIKRSGKKKKKKQEKATQETQKAQEQKAASSSFAEKYPQFSRPAAQPEQPTQSPTAQPQPPPTGDRNCPACGKVVKGGFNFCMFCGSKRSS